MSLQVAPLPLYEKQGRVWMQRTEGDPYFLLTDAGMTGINYPAPTPTAIRSMSTQTRTGSRVIDITDGDTDLSQFTVPTRLQGMNNVMLAIVEETVNVQLLSGPDGQPTQYGGAELGLGWVLCRRGTGTTATGASATSDNAGEGVPVNFETPFTAVLGPIPIDWATKLQRKPSPGTAFGMTAVHVLPQYKDPDTKDRILRGEIGIMTETPDSLATAKVFIWTDGLKAVTPPTAADPFAADEVISSVTGFGSKSDARFLASVAITAAVLPRVAYTDDYGASWITATLGAVAGDGVSKLFYVDASNIFAVGGQTGSSKVWKSCDGGATWAETDVGLNEPLLDVSIMGNGMGYAVGESNTIAKLTNFQDWEILTGPAGGAGDNINTVAVKPSSGAVYIGNDAGELYVSYDEGLTWEDVTTTIQGFTPTSITNIEFDAMSGEMGYLSLLETAVAKMVRTTDGGSQWKNYGLGDGGGLTVNFAVDISVFGSNQVVSVGITDGSSNTVLEADSNFDAAPGC